MPITTSKYELGKILSGEADGVTRMFSGPCPFNVGDETWLADSQTPGEGNAFAMVTIKTIRPCTVAERMQDERLARMDGFTSANAWTAHFERLYGAQKGDTQLYRFQFLFKEMNKDAR